MCTRFCMCTRAQCVYVCTCVCLHVHTACAHTCMYVCACVVCCVHECVLTSWTLPVSACVLKPTQPSARLPGALRSSSSICSASEFRALKTLAGSSRKLCLCGNEVPSAPQPSYWLIDDMIPRGSPVIPGNTLYFMCFAAPFPAPSRLPTGVWFPRSDGAAPREAAAVAFAAFSQPAARPLVSVDTTIMCAGRLKGPFGIFRLLKVFPFPQPCAQPLGTTAVTWSLAVSGALEWAHPGSGTKGAGTADRAGCGPCVSCAGALQTARRRVRSRAARAVPGACAAASGHCPDGVCACAGPART